MFKQKIFHLLTITTSVIIMTACSSSTERNQFIECKEPRPEMCTMGYLPVCGANWNHSTKTYPNACGACSNNNITGYTRGACLKR